MRTFIDIINRLLEGDVVRFPKEPARPVAATPHDQKMTDAMRSLRAFMNDKRPIEHKYETGDVLVHRGTGTVVDVVSSEPKGDTDAVLTVKNRANGRDGQFLASEFDPAPVEHW